MSRLVGLLGLAALLACNAPPREPGDPWPRSCGVQGPIDLFEIPANCFNVEIGSLASAQRAGDFYLFGCGTNLGSYRWWTVDRCGTQRADLPVRDVEAQVAALGTWIVECVPPDGPVYAHDPRGLAAPRLVFDSSRRCAVTAVGEGVATVSDTGHTVLFHPAPLDPTVSRRVVTDRASMKTDFADWRPSGAMGTNGISRTVREELVIIVDDGSLVTYDPSADRLRTIDEGPVDRAERIDDRLVHVELADDDGFVLDLDSERRIAFPKIQSGPVQRLGDWLVQGGSDTSSETDVRLRAVHLHSGEAVDTRGRGDWHPLAQLTDNTLIVDIDWERAIVWPSSGWRQAIDLPGAMVWSSPLGDGVYSYSTWDEAPGLFFVANADEPVVTVAADAHVVFPMQSGHIVYRRWPHPADPLPAMVRKPDGTTTQLESTLKAPAGFIPDAALASGFVGTDELLYVVPTADGGSIVRGTRLP